MPLSAGCWGVDCTHASPPAQHSCTGDIPNNRTYNAGALPRPFLCGGPPFVLNSLSLDPDLACPGSSFVSPNLFSIPCPRLVSSHKRSCIWVTSHSFLPTVRTRHHSFSPLHGQQICNCHLGRQFIRCNQVPILGLSAASYSGHLKAESQRP